MAELRMVKTKTKYDVRDALCIGRACLSLGIYQHRGATLSGSRNTGAVTPCCMTRAYRGCPPTEGEMMYSAELAQTRKTEGWRVVR